MITYLRYYDLRYGDTYEVYLDHEGNFHSARRYVETIGRDAIYYDDLNEIPAAHRNVIESMIIEQQQKENV